MVVHGEEGILTNPKRSHVLFVDVCFEGVSTPASENEVRFIYPVTFLNFRILEFWGFQGFWRVEGLSWV
jgi:hypothetical protein